MCLTCAGKPSNIADKTFLAIAKKDQIHVICDNCRILPPAADMTSIANSMATFMTKFETIAENLNKVTENLAAITERIDKFESRVSELEQRANSTTPPNFADVFEAINELEQRKAKKNNLVIHFLPDDGNFKDNQDMNGGGLIGDDREKVEKLVQATNGDPTSILKVSRMGGVRKDGKPRPLKVECNNEWTKRGLITGQNRLKDQFPIMCELKTFIRDDLTWRQREEDKKLRDELKVIREQNPDKLLVIRNSKICEKKAGKVVPFL